MSSYADLIILCEDINSRVGNELDYIPEIDTVKERKILDTSKNTHGKLFIEFLKDAKLCIVNGRVNANKDNYTFVSTRGKSVVDYFCVPHECPTFCEDFEVFTMTDIVNENNIYTLNSELSKIPDHSILCGKFQCLYVQNTSNMFNESSKHIDKKQLVTTDNNKQYKFERVPPEFMKSSMWKDTILTLTENIEKMLYSQESIDNMYTKLTKIDEMDRYLDTKGASRKTRKYLKFSKPYWDDNLTVLWKNMCKCEKGFLKVSY